MSEHFKIRKKRKHTTPAERRAAWSALVSFHQEELAKKREQETKSFKRALARLTRDERHRRKAVVAMIQATAAEPEE